PLATAPAPSRYGGGRFHPVRGARAPPPGPRRREGRRRRAWRGAVLADRSGAGSSEQPLQSSEVPAPQHVAREQDFERRDREERAERDRVRRRYPVFLVRSVRRLL